jgi:ferric-dicitrate binding protein FerR (iron transport regulator)
LELDGEAYFKVKKGSVFSVVTEQGSVTVLGTEFSVKSRDQYYEVVCYEGKVRVDGIKLVELGKNELFRVIDTTLAETQSHQTLIPSWIMNESRFNSVPISEVFDEFERQYGVEFTRKGIPQDRLFTGSFTHEDLNLALRSVTLPMNIRFEIVDDKSIVLTSAED